MKKIEPLIPGDSKRTAFSAEVMNEIITAVNALIGMRGEGGTRVYAAEAGYVIYSSGSLGSGSLVSGSITSGSTVIYDGRDTWL